MSKPESDAAPEEAPEVRERMDALAAKLAAQGLHTTVQVIRREPYITAAVHRVGSKDIEVVIDPDGYTELRYWADPAAGSEQAVAVIGRVLAAITGTDTNQSGDPPPT
jgi:hypothetical protein